MTSTLSPTPLEQIRKYPMGPKLRSFLEIPDAAYLGESSPATSDQEREFFLSYVTEKIHLKKLDSLDKVTDLIDELVTMDLPEAIMTIAANYPDLKGHNDFRCQLSLGVGAMLTRDFELAEAALTQAQQAIPAEPAPYINMVQVMLAQSRIEEATIWCESGLEVEPNNHNLWELLAHLKEITDGDAFNASLMRFAERFNSWAGFSLAASLSSTGDRYLKVNLLEKLYAQGERDPLFLIEFTAALGVAGEMEKIPQIVWLAETASKGSQLSWQLLLHAAQANLAMDRFDECLAYLKKTEAQKHLPEQAIPVIAELRAEADLGLSKRAPSELN